MIQIDLTTTSSRLSLSPSRDCLRLWPAVGGAQMVLSLDAQRHGGDDERQSPLMVSAKVHVSAASHQGLRYLTRFTADDPVSPSPIMAPIKLAGYISDEQVRAAEAIRAGGPLWVRLEATVVTVEEDPVHLAGRNGALSFPLPTTEWTRELERIDTGSYVELLVSITDEPDHANATRRLRTARTLIREGRPEEAIGEARKALEAVRKMVGSAAANRRAQGKDPKARDQDERWACLIEDLFGLASGAAHDDPGTTEHFRWSRQDAETIVATVAGLLLRKA